LRAVCAGGNPTRTLKNIAQITGSPQRRAGGSAITARSHFLPLNSCTASIMATMFSTGVCACTL
jgi:hypothetical protein